MLTEFYILFTLFNVLVHLCFWPLRAVGHLFMAHSNFLDDSVMAVSIDGVFGGRNSIELFNSC